MKVLYEERLNGCNVEEIFLKLCQKPNHGPSLFVEVTVPASRRRSDKGIRYFNNFIYSICCNSWTNLLEWQNRGIGELKWLFRKSKWTFFWRCLKTISYRVKFWAELSHGLFHLYAMANTRRKARGRNSRT